MSSTYKPPRFVLIGRVLKPHGVRGEVLVEAFTDLPERFIQLKTVYMSKKEGQTPILVDVVSARSSGHRILMQFVGYNDRNEADALRGRLLQVPFEEAIPLEENEFFIFELYGMSVKTDDGVDLGTISDVIQTGANDVFVVNGAQGEVLIPDTEEVVLKIERETREITVHLIPGLLA